jgi:uncharacterized protein (UPF0332 family)
MIDSISAQTLLEKAENAWNSAHTRLAFQDIDGGYHNIYKAVTLSAQAALRATLSPSNIQGVRTYNDLVRVFYSHLVATGLVPTEIAHILLSVQDIRLDADTNGTSVSLVDARLMIVNAERFVIAMRALIAQ